MIFYDPLESTIKNKDQPPFSFLKKYYIPHKIIYSSKKLLEMQYDILNIIWPSFYVSNVEDFWNTYEKKVSGIQKVVKKNNIKFYFNSYDTGVPPTDLIEQILKINQIIGVNLKDITVITGNSYEKLILEQMLIGKGLIGVKFEIGDREIVNACIDYMQYLNDSYKKRFIFLCRRLTPWRTLIFFDLIRRGILPIEQNNTYNNQTDAFFTWSKFDPYGATEDSNQTVISMTKHLLKKTDNKKYATMMNDWITKNAEKICEDSPYIIPGELEEKKDRLMSHSYPESVQNKYPAIYQNTRPSLANALNSSSLSLTVETQYAAGSPELLHLTEKTIRTMFFKLPFIQYSNPTFLAKLRAMGFQTFNDFWDESYDNEYDPFERMLKINDQVEMLNRMKPFEFHDLIAQTSDVTNHNYKKMWELTRNYISDSEQKNELGGLLWNNIIDVKG